MKYSKSKNMAHKISLYILYSNHDYLVFSPAGLWPALAGKCVEGRIQWAMTSSDPIRAPQTLPPRCGLDVHQPTFLDTFTNITKIHLNILASSKIRGLDQTWPYWPYGDPVTITREQRTPRHLNHTSDATKRLITGRVGCNGQLFYSRSFNPHYRYL
jgi:hypothetical protein